MNAALAWRLVTETHPVVLGRFAFNFGWKGARSVRRFRRRLDRGEVFPAFLFLSVTSGCNLRCQGCWVVPDGSTRQLDRATLDRVVAEAARHGTTTFGILGGEPLLYPGLGDLFRAHSGCYFLLFTNGTLLDEATARALRRAANVSPVISVEGGEVESDRRRGGQGVLQRTLAGIEACTRHGLVTGVATSICAGNFAELVNRRFLAELVALGVHYLWISVYRPVGPDPAPEQALSAEQLFTLRRFMVEARAGTPLLVVDSYWDHDGRALCPAAVGIGHHIGPGGDLEPCPPIQFAVERLTDGVSVYELFCRSSFLAEFRRLAATTSRGCLLLERPDLLAAMVSAHGARDSSGRGTAAAELAAMTPRASHHLPGQEVPERSWPYRLAKRSWFFGFGAYG